MNPLPCVDAGGMGRRVLWVEGGVGFNIGWIVVHQYRDYIGRESFTLEIFHSAVGSAVWDYVFQHLLGYRTRTR